jgi:Icc-related predicted phosphoesterase
MTGKGLVPLVDAGGGRWYTHLHDERYDFADDELEAYEHRIREQGLYPFRVPEDEVDALLADSARLDALFNEHVLATVERWVALADERLAGSSVRCFVCPGNDDMFEIDEILEQSRTLELAEGRVLDLPGGFQLASTGWSNRTPWDTHREEDEDSLALRIRAMVDKVTAPPERVIFNFHCPPHGTSLDEAPALDDELQIVSAGRVLKHVGSTAVREAIEEAEPALAVHGHIHESRGVTRLGRTLAVNPGSSYEQGTLLGAVVEVSGKKKVKHYHLTNG